MRLWQTAMASLAKSDKVTEAMQSSPLVQRFSSQFVGGTDAEQVLRTARQLRERGLRISLFSLGEYLRDADLIEQSVAALQGIIPGLSQAAEDIHLSVDPTQMGASINWSLCERNFHRVAEAMAAADSPSSKVLMIDMEDSEFTSRTLDLWSSLRDRGYPVAVTVQAYLRRSQGDIARLISIGASVRLVKGALAEKPSVAFASRADIDSNYEMLTDMLLSEQAKANGVFPAFGTHDERMIAHALAQAGANQWQPGSWEFEMLYGVREPLQQQLLAEGQRLRLYTPFGKNFWAYSIRRIGENPQNLKFVARAMREVLSK